MEGGRAEKEGEREKLRAREGGRGGMKRWREGRKDGEMERWRDVVKEREGGRSLQREEGRGGEEAMRVTEWLKSLNRHPDFEKYILQNTLTKTAHAPQQQSRWI